SVPCAYLVAWLNSALIRSLIELQADAYVFVTGIIKKLPWERPPDTIFRELVGSAEEMVRLARTVWAQQETDPYFAGWALDRSVLSTAAALGIQTELSVKRTAELSRQFDAAIDRMYGISSVEVQDALSGASDASENSIEYDSTNEEEQSKDEPGP